MQSQTKPQAGAPTEGATVTLGVIPASLITILKQVDKQGSAWSFNGLDTRVEPDIRLVLNIEGQDTPHEVKLHHDGTWSASTAITLDAN